MAVRAGPQPRHGMQRAAAGLASPGRQAKCAGDVAERHRLQRSGSHHGGKELGGKELEKSETGIGGEGGSRCRDQHQTLEREEKNNLQRSASAGFCTRKGVSLELSSSEVCNSFGEG